MGREEWQGGPTNKLSSVLRPRRKDAWRGSIFTWNWTRQLYSTITLQHTPSPPRPEISSTSTGGKKCKLKCTVKKTLNSRPIPASYAVNVTWYMPCKVTIRWTAYITTLAHVFMARIRLHFFIIEKASLEQSIILFVYWTCRVLKCMVNTLQKIRRKIVLKCGLNPPPKKNKLQVDKKKKWDCYWSSVISRNCILRLNHPYNFAFRLLHTTPTCTHDNVMWK